VLAERGLAQPDPTRRGTTLYATSGDPAAFERLLRRLGLPEGNVIPAATVRA
jgi:hypothetical protein